MVAYLQSVLSSSHQVPSDQSMQKFPTTSFAKVVIASRVTYQLDSFPLSIGTRLPMVVVNSIH